MLTKPSVIFGNWFKERPLKPKERICMITNWLGGAAALLSLHGLLGLMILFDPLVDSNGEWKLT